MVIQGRDIYGKKFYTFDYRISSQLKLVTRTGKEYANIPFYRNMAHSIHRANIAEIKRV